MKEIILNVEGMSCEGCEKRIINTLSEIENVKEVIANYKENKVILKIDEEVNLNHIKEKIEDLGFEVKE